MTSISDFSSVYFNTLKACMGTGILEFPLIFQIHGIFYTVIFTVISLLASLFGCFLYIDLNEWHGKNLTMASLSKHIFPSMKRSVDIIVMIKCFLLTLVYFGRIKSIFSTLFADFELESILKIKPYLGAGIGIIATAFLLSYPITWETLNSLTKFSLLCFVGVVILFFGSFSVTKGKTSEVVFISDNRDFVSSVGYFVFGFSCHQNILSIHNETKMKPSLFKLCITLSLISVAFIYLAFGYINYKAFSDIPNDIFIIWPACKAKSFTVLTYLCIIVFSIPFQVFPCKNHFGDLVGTSQKSKKIIGIAILLSTAIYAATVKVEFKKVMKIMSSSLSTCMCFGFPIFYEFFYKGKKSLFNRVMMMYLAAFTFVCFYSFISTLFYE